MAEPQALKPDTMMRGGSYRIWPNKRQTQMLDLWRNRCRSLWNLLLELEQAAYSGENRKSRLGWRSIWAQVLEEDFASDTDAYHHGKYRRDGTAIKEPGIGREDERDALKQSLKRLKKGSREAKEVQAKLKAIAVKPTPPDQAMLAKIRRQAVETDPETGDELPAKLFVWEEELQKVMARLKTVPRTEWIAGLPSHAAQAVVKDLIKALQAMLRERGKRASGAGGRDTGFPKFKKARYAAGSVYFANTQLKFDFEKNRVQFPNGVGWVRCEIPIAIRLDANSNTTWRPKLMGGRAWRQGEEWFLSCQWEMRKPAPLPTTRRIAGVKIAAGILLTTMDDRGQTKEYKMPPPDKKRQALHKLAGKQLSRVIEAHKRANLKKDQITAARRAKLAARGVVKQADGRKIAKSGSFFDASARLAKLEAAERDVRDDFLHKLTTSIVHTFDAIAVQKMDVAGMMEKETTRARRRARRAKDTVEAAKVNAAEETRPRRPMKPVRKLMRHVAMARTVQLLEYKFKDLRGDASFNAIDKHDVNASACGRCGTVHPQWQDGRRVVRCESRLEDGSICGSVLMRNRNAAAVSRQELRARRAAAGPGKTTIQADDM
jgi:transposase